MDNVNGGLLVEGVKGGCTGIKLPQENATEPFGKHTHSSPHHTNITTNSDTEALRGIWNRWETIVRCYFHIVKKAGSLYG